jgi:hypothetical protein
MVDVPPANAELRFLREMLEAPLKIVRRECEIAIELYQKIPVITPARIVTFVEGFHHPATRLAEAPVRSVNDSNPRMLRSISIDHRAGLVRGAVIYDNPLNRPYSLSKNRLERALDVCLLVAHRGDDYVSSHLVDRVA